MYEKITQNKQPNCVKRYRIWYTVHYPNIIILEGNRCTCVPSVLCGGDKSHFHLNIIMEIGTLGPHRHETQVYPGKSINRSSFPLVKTQMCWPQKNKTKCIPERPITLESSSDLSMESNSIKSQPRSLELRFPELLRKRLKSPVN